MELTIAEMQKGQSDWLHNNFNKMGWSKPEGYFENCYKEQQDSEIVLLVAQINGQYCGHVKVVWNPDYPYFCDNKILEIQDLNVLPEYRRRRVGSRLMDKAEAIVAETSNVVGIGVGLHPGYNAAQRMYVLRGYVPDGQGVSYNDVYVREGQIVKMDDALALHFTKLYFARR